MLSLYVHLFLFSSFSVPPPPPPSRGLCTLSFGTIINNYRRRREGEKASRKPFWNLLLGIVWLQGEWKGTFSPRPNTSVISSAKLIRARLATFLSDPVGWSFPPSVQLRRRTGNLWTALADPHVWQEWLEWFQRPEKCKWLKLKVS